MFCQIDKCLRYAKRHNRLVYVDTETNPKFLEPLSLYLAPLSPHLKFIDHLGAKEILRNAKTVIPEVHWDYQAVWDLENNSFVEKASREKLTFDFRTSHKEEVLLHHQAGGGLDSGSLLLEMKLTQHLTNLLATRLSKFPKEYDAAHVRYSDYESDYVNFLPMAVSKKVSVLFLSTDNDQVIEWARANLPWVQTLSYEKSKNRNIEGFCDLFMLANARTVIPVPLINSEVAFSGYSRLASLMWTSLCPSLLNQSLPKLKMIFLAIGGVRQPIMSILRIIIFSPLLLRSRFSRLGVLADMRNLTRRFRA